MKKTKIDWCDYRVGESRIVSGKYILVYCPGHPHAKSKGHIYEHRYMMEKHLRRFLETGEHVHHLNRDGNDNSIENLRLINPSSHAQEHYRADPERIIKGTQALNRHAAAIKLERREIQCACGCGSTLINRDSKARLRKYLPGHNARGRHWEWRNRSE